MEKSILGLDLFVSVEFRNQGSDIGRARWLTQVFFHEVELIGFDAFASIETVSAHLSDEKLTCADFPDDLCLGFGAMTGRSAEDIVRSSELEEIRSCVGVGHGR